MPATIDEISAIAVKQLAEWQPKLSEKCFIALAVKCEEEWRQADPAKPYEYFRGNQLTEFVCNWKP